MKNICFDLCAIPMYMLILYTCSVRGLTNTRAYRIFNMMNLISLICAVLDVCMELLVNPLPISQVSVYLAMGVSFFYKLLRNAGLVIYLLFIFIITRTEHRIRSGRIRTLIWLPNALLVLLLVANFFNHKVFVVTAEGGYARGACSIISMYVRFCTVFPACCTVCTANAIWRWKSGLPSCRSMS